MAGNGKVFISHTHDDNARCADLIAALDAWGVDYWFDTGQTDAQVQLSPELQKAINERDIFIRICTANTARSMGMNMEAGVFRVAQAGMSARRRGERLFINLILDPLYQREPFDNATIVLDGATRPRVAWVSDLGRALGLGPNVRLLNRRAFIGLGAAVAVTVASASAAGIMLAKEQTPSAGQSKVTLDVSHTPFSPRWQTRVRKDGTPGVAISSKTLIAIGDSEMPTVALSTVDGRQLWSSSRAVSSFGVPPIVVGTTVVIPGDSATVYGLDIRSGKELWTATAGDLNGESAPTFADGIVYLNGDDGVLYAIQVSSGDPVWHKLFSLRPSSSSTTPLSTPLIAGGVAYVGSLDGYLYAFDAKTGSVNWKQQTRGPIFSSPATSQGRVYIGSTDGYVYAFQASGGKPLWRFRTGGSVISSATLMDGALYIGSMDQYVYALDAATGGLYWAMPAGDKDSNGMVQHSGDGVTARPALSRAARAVYGIAGGALYGFNVRDGSRRGHFTTGASEFSRGFSPAVSDEVGLAFFGAGDGVVYAVNL